MKSKDSPSSLPLKFLQSFTLHRIDYGNQILFKLRGFEISSFSLHFIERTYHWRRPSLLIFYIGSDFQKLWSFSPLIICLAVWVSEWQREDTEPRAKRGQRMYNGSRQQTPTPVGPGCAETLQSEKPTYKGQF